MTGSRFTSLLAPWITVLVLACSAFLWVLRPEGRWAWLAAALVLPAGWLGLLLRRRAGALAADSPGVEGVRTAITLGGVVLLAPLVLTLAAELGWVEPATRAGAAARLPGVLVGLVLAGYANVLPRRLTPLAARGCAPAEVQAYQRFAGWVFVLAGLASAVVWLTAPIGRAALVSVFVVGTGLLLVVLRYLRLASRRVPAPPR